MFSFRATSDGRHGFRENSGCCSASNTAPFASNVGRLQLILLHLIAALDLSDPARVRLDLSTRATATRSMAFCCVFFFLRPHENVNAILKNTRADRTVGFCDRRFHSAFQYVSVHRGSFLSMSTSSCSRSFFLKPRFGRDWMASYLAFAGFVARALALAQILSTLLIGGGRRVLRGTRAFRREHRNDRVTVDCRHFCGPQRTDLSHSGFGV